MCVVHADESNIEGIFRTLITQNMQNKDIALIKSIIEKHLDADVNRAFVFGSRATDDATQYSDYDIGIEGERIKASVYFDIVDAFEQSDLPFMVDLVDFNTVSENFERIAKKKIKMLN